MSTLRARILALVDTQDERGGFSEEAFAQLEQLVGAIRRESPVPDPALHPQCLDGRWESVFAHFGARHSAGKSRVHDSTLKVQSFNRFPPVPIRVLRICQEIGSRGAAYNNVIDFVAADGRAEGRIVVRGLYRVGPAEPQRFDVDFQSIEIAPRGATDEPALRAALGFTRGEPLAAGLKPPRVHSDVVYLDEEIRINIGSLGGLYLLRRCAEPPVSIDLG
ncbi:MAG: PAP/fibrillin family protein [Steroidobacteraceae bacterium]